MNSAIAREFDRAEIFGATDTPSVMAATPREAQAQAGHRQYRYSAGSFRRFGRAATVGRSPWPRDAASRSCLDRFASAATVSRQRPAEQIGGGIRPAHLKRQHPKLLKRVRMIRRHRQDLPVNLLGLLQIPLLMLLHRQLKGLFEGKLRHDRILRARARTGSAALKSRNVPLFEVFSTS